MRRSASNSPISPGGPTMRSGALPLQQVIGLEQPGQAEVVVGVEMGDVDVVDLDEPGRVDHLPLGPLPASTRIRLPPERISTQAVALRAEGTEPPVPRKTTERSMARQA